VVGMTEPGQSDGMTSAPANYPRYRFPAEIISYAVCGVAPIRQDTGLVETGHG